MGASDEVAEGELLHYLGGAVVVLVVWEVLEVLSLVCSIVKF